jgi:polyhydroxybutyrate depolymerase
MPLVVMLHGYGASGAIEEGYLGLTSVSDQRGFLYVHPDGTVNQSGLRFWNATPACCNFFASTVDDSGYLSSVISGVAARYSVDAKRVYIVGHSNGAFMAHRMACDHAGQIAAIASLAGAMFEDISRCAPSSPVSVLQIHGTADDTILYNGGTILANTYPSAPTTVADWVSIDGCTDVPDLSAPALDLVNTLPGAETTVTQYAAGCTAGSTVELWTMEGASHIPAFTPQFAPDVIDFFFAHPKP